MQGQRQLAATTIGYDSMPFEHQKSNQSAHLSPPMHSKTPKTGGNSLLRDNAKNRVAILAQM